MKNTSHGLNGNALKLIAILAMTGDHIAWCFLPTQTPAAQILHIFGRIVAPLMAYFVAEGYFYTRNRHRYLFRLFLFAVLSHIPYCLCFHAGKLFPHTGVIWGLFCGLLALCLLKASSLTLPLRFFLIALCGGCAWFADWSIITVAWILICGILHDEREKQLPIFALCCFLFSPLPTLLDALIKNGWTGVWQNCYQLGVLLAPLLLLFYNRTRGKKNILWKYGFYAYYPLHLLGLWVLKSFLAA